MARRSKGRRVTGPRDLPVGGRRASLRWCKRRWCCDERSCRRGSFTEAVSAVPARKRMTARLRAAAGAAVADGGRTVVKSARDHELSWPVVAAAFAAHAAAALPSSRNRSRCWASMRPAGDDEIHARRGHRHVAEHRRSLARRILRSVGRARAARSGRGPHRPGRGRLAPGTPTAVA